MKIKSNVSVALLKGVYAGIFKDVGVDANGNMIAVMKGDYSGALKTWKVDDEGRGEMFINDPTDVWGNVVSTGLSEHSLLVRAPPRSFDRRGSVIRWVDFESSSPNYEISKTVNTTFSRSNDVVNHGNFSGKIVLPANANDYCRILQYTNDFHIGNMGYMAMFSSADTFFNLYIKLRYYDGTTVYDAELQYLYSTGALYVNTPGGVVAIEAIPRYKSMYNFSTLKLVADFSSGKYIRALMFGKEYDLSAYTIRTAGSGSVKHIESMFEVKGSATAISTVYVDDMVITENEPEN